MRSVVSALLLFLAPCALAQSFEGLGDLPGGAVSSLAFGVSADGEVVAGYSSGPDGVEAFRWTEAAGMRRLGFIPGDGYQSRAKAISADGEVVVGVGSTVRDGRGVAEAVRWTEATGMQSLGTLGEHPSDAFGASADGSVVVGYSRTSDGSEAFRWTAGSGMQSLGDLPGGAVSSQAYGVSADGSVIVGSDVSSNGGEAFRWTAATGMEGLGDLPGGSFRSRASAVSADGSVIVGSGASEDGVEEAFRWTEIGGMVGLGDLPGGQFRSDATATSSDGSVIVGESVGANGIEAFVWTADDGMQPLKAVLEALGLDLAGWTLNLPTDVSDDGSVIVGWGLNPQGEVEAWRAEWRPTAQWLDPVSGFYNEPTRWSILDIPSGAHRLLFDAPTSPFYSVTFVQSQAARSVVVDSSNVSLALGGATLALGSGLHVCTRPGRPSVLGVEGGTVTAPEAAVGLAAGCQGSLSLGADAPATLDIDGVLTVGGSGSGGVEATEDGSTITARQGLWVASEAGSTGSVLVAGSLLQVPEGRAGTFVGRSGTGTLGVIGGTLSLAGETVVGSGSSANGTLGLSAGASGATLDTLWVGFAGTGGLEIESGSVLTSGAVVLGQLEGSLGTALVHGPGSAWQVRDLVIGGAGAGLLTLDDGGALHLSGSVLLNELSTTNTNGGTVCVGAACVVPTASAARPGGTLLTTPTLLVAEGATLDAGAVLLQEGGTLGGGGTLAFPLVNEGTLAPGGPGAPGALALTGEYRQASGGALAVELGGLAPGAEHDRLAVTGSASLGGTLAVSLLGGYVPAVGDAFTLLTAADVFGAFGVVSLPEGIAADLAVSAGAVTLTVTGVTVDAEAGAEAPPLALSAWPNPSFGDVRVRYALPAGGPAHLAVYDALGREVATLARGPHPAGAHEATLVGAALPAGVYVVRLRTPAGARSQTVTRIR